MYGAGTMVGINLGLPSGFYSTPNNSGWVGGTGTINLPGGTGTVVISGGSGTPGPVVTGPGGPVFTTPQREQGLISVGALIVILALAYIFFKK